MILWMPQIHQVVHTKYVQFLYIQYSNKTVLKKYKQIIQFIFESFN